MSKTANKFSAELRSTAITKMSIHRPIKSVTATIGSSAQTLNE